MENVPSVRDLAVTAVIFGVAAFVWFGWAQEAPPTRWRLPLGVGSVLGLALAAVGGVLAWQHWGPDTALAEEQARVAFGIVCGVEFGAAGLGAAGLALTQRSQWIASWIALVVGAHFVPLAFIFRDPGMIVLAVLVVLAAAASVPVHRRTGIAPSAVAGLGTGLAFVVFAGRAITLVAL